MMKRRQFIASMAAIAASRPAFAQHRSNRVLWFNGLGNTGQEVTAQHRQAMANYIDNFQDGQSFEVDFISGQRGGILASQLSRASYSILILDLTSRNAFLSRADKSAIQNFYSGGRKALMLDGSFAIRNIRHNPRTVFPGTRESSGALLINQVSALADNGGGILIGTDHNVWQRNANVALSAIVPRAQFQGLTNPSTVGDFISDTLLGRKVAIRARDILRHWESVPNQGEAPVGNFSDFQGNPVTLYSLVEIADKPGRGRKRPYISASFDPGSGRVPVDSDEPFVGNIPTHKSGSNN